MSFSEWKKYKIGELVDNERGISYGIVQPGEFLKEGGVPILKVNNLTQGNVSLKDVYRVKKEVEGKFLRTRLIGNEILVSLVGSLGHIFRVTKEQIGWNVVRAIGVLPIKKEFNKDFIFWVLKHPDVQADFINYATHTVQATLNLKELKEIEVSIPSSKTQQRIASILSSLDDKINNNLKTNQTLEEITRTIFNEWFEFFSYPGAGGSKKHTEFGEIPSNWEVGGIGEICYVQNGYAFKSNDFRKEGDIGIIKIRNINGNVVDIEKTDFVDANIVARLDKKFKIESGSLLIAMTGAEVGKIGLMPLTEKEFWLNQRVGMFKENIPYGNLFMYILLSSETYQNNVQNAALGSAQPNISASAIESIRAIIPPAELIEAFGKIVKPMYENILDNLAENETLKIARDILLPKLMSGEIDVNISNS